MKHQESRFTAHDGLDIFYQAWTPEAAARALIVIAHGMGEHSGRYAHYVDALVPKGYALWAMDLRGCGQAAGRRGHVDRFGDFLADLQQLHRLARAWDAAAPLFVLGHSFGSLIALTYALRFPDDLAGVISSGTALRDALPYPDWVRSLIRRAGRAVPTLAAPSGLKPEYVSRDAAEVEAYRRDPLVHGVGTLRWASEAIAIREWLMQHAGEWKLPLLMVHGGDDRVCLPEGAKSFRAQITQAQVEYREYAGMYHEVHNEIGKETVFKDIEDWLEKTLG